MEQHRDSHIEDLHNWLQCEEAVALGECGLELLRIK